MPLPAAGLELFGVALETASSDELRAAAKEAGVVPIREAGEDDWFDIYDSSAVLPGTTRLYLGFVKQNQRFAFAEYEFTGLNPTQMLHNLSAKYGEAEVSRGRFMSDRSYRWQADGIEISLSSDWQNYRSRLSYIEPANLATLRAERSSPVQEEPLETVVSVY